MERGGLRDVRALSRHAVLPAGKAADREPLRVSIREQRRVPGVRFRRERNRGTRRGASSRRVSGAPSSSGTPFQARRAATSRWRVASWTPDPLLCRKRDVRPRSLLRCAGALHRDAATRRLRSPFTRTPGLLRPREGVAARPSRNAPPPRTPPPRVLDRARRRSSAAARERPAPCTRGGEGLRYGVSRARPAASRRATPGPAGLAISW